MSLSVHVLLSMCPWESVFLSVWVPNVCPYHCVSMSFSCQCVSLSVCVLISVWLCQCDFVSVTFSVRLFQWDFVSNSDFVIVCPCQCMSFSACVTFSQCPLESLYLSVCVPIVCPHHWVAMSLFSCHTVFLSVCAPNSVSTSLFSCQCVCVSVGLCFIGSVCTFHGKSLEVVGSCELQCVNLPVCISGKSYFSMLVSMSVFFQSHTEIPHYRYTCRAGFLPFPFSPLTEIQK